MTPWSLESELCAFAAVREPRRAILKLGLCGGAPVELEPTVETPWVRSGAETYCCTFSVAADGDISRWILKACVSSAGSLTDVVAEWVRRRHLLDIYGVNTPRLIGVNNATLLEEHVPYSWLKALEVAGGVCRRSLLAEAARTLGVVNQLGFPGLGVVSDLRSRGCDAVIVDFGQDLGPPNIGIPSTSAELDQLIAAVEHYTATSLSSDEMMFVLTAYEHGKQQVLNRW